MPPGHYNAIKWLTWVWAWSDRFVTYSGSSEGTASSSTESKGEEHMRSLHCVFWEFVLPSWGSPVAAGTAVTGSYLQGNRSHLDPLSRNWPRSRRRSKSNRTCRNLCVSVELAAEKHVDRRRGKVEGFRSRAELKQRWTSGTQRVLRTPASKVKLFL